MADGDGNFVADLAKQQSCRPKYSRVISWELSRDSNEEASGKRKKQRSFEKKLRKERRILEQEQKLQKDNESSASGGSEDSKSSAESLSGLNLPTDVSVKKLAKTMIGKKAKDRRSKEMFACAISDLSTINLGVDTEFAESHHSTGEFLVSNKPVPSLVDLCLRVDWKVKNMDGEIRISDIPPGLRNIVRTKQQMCRVNAKDLKSLHITLATREAASEHYVETDSEDSERTQLIRSVGGVIKYANPASGYDDIDIVSVSSVEDGGFLNHNAVLESVVQTMDLMLPPVVRRKKRETDETDSSSTLRSALKKRYPKLMTYAFDEALPYVWWSRGNYGLANAAFLRLIEKQTGKRKGLYLNEIGRLHLYQNEPDLSIPYFKEAQNAVSSVTTAKDSAISVQTLLLCANAYDQGILDENKAAKSFKFWQGATKCHGAPLSVMRYAVEALLNIHLSSYLGNMDKLKNIKDELERNIEKYPALGFHLSCLNLIFDDEMLANHSLRDSSISSSIWNPVFEQKKKGPLPTMDVVWRTQLLPPMLFVLDDHAMIHPHHGWYWGNQFCDLYGIPLQLRQTHDGYVTGNMRMLLPAMRSILLDPYTGIVSFPEVPLRPESLSSHRPNPRQYVGQTGLPYHYTLLEMPDGSRIQYHESQNSSRSSSGKSACNMLCYTTPNGKVLEVNVMALVRAAEYLQQRELFMSQKKETQPRHKANWKKNRARRLEQKNDEENETYYEREFRTRSEEYIGSAQYKKDCLAMLRRLYQEHKELYCVQDHVRYEFHMKLKKELDKDPKAKMKYKKHHTTYGYPIESSSIGNWYFYDPSPDEVYTLDLRSFKVYGYTVVLQFRDSIVIVNCKDENTFQEPKTYLIPRDMKRGNIRNDFDWAIDPIEEGDEMLMIPTTTEFYHPDAKVIGLYQFTYNQKLGNTLYIFDEDGKVLRKNTNLKHVRNPTAGRLELSCVIGTHLYGIPLRGDRVFCDHIDRSTMSEKFSHRLIQLQSFKQNLILGTSIGIAFMNKTMKLCKINVESITSKSKFVRPVVSEYGHYLRFDGDNTAEYKCNILNRMQALDTCCPLIVAHECHVLVIGSMGDESVEILQHVELPASGVEAHYISKKVGFVVSFTLSGSGDRDYREHVLHFDTTGTIKSILPFNGHGLRDFFSVELPENKDVQGQGKHVGKPGWYLYLNDGHGGIQCIYMGETD